MGGSGRPCSRRQDTPGLQTPMSRNVFESFLGKKAGPSLGRRAGTTTSKPSLEDDGPLGRAAFCSEAATCVVDIEDLHLVIGLRCAHPTPTRDATINNRDAVPDDGWTVVSYHHHQPRRLPERVLRISRWHQSRRASVHDEMNADLDGFDLRRTHETCETQVTHRSLARMRESRLIRPRSRGRRGFAFDATCGYPGEGPGKGAEKRKRTPSANDGNWHTQGKVVLASIRKNFPGADDGAIISEAQRLISTGTASSDKLTAEQLRHLVKLWPSALTPCAPKPKAAVKLDQVDEVKVADAHTAEHMRKQKRDKAAHQAKVETANNLRALTGPGAAAIADAVDPTNVPPIPPIGGDDLESPFLATFGKSIQQSEKDAALYDQTVDEIISLVHLKFQFASIHSASDCDSVRKTVHAWAKTRDFVGLTFSLNQHYQRIGEGCQGWLLRPAHEVIESIFDRELHLFATSRRRLIPARYCEGVGATGTTFCGFTARDPITATIFDGLCGRPNINEYTQLDSMLNLPLASASEIARKTTPLSLRSSEGTPMWKLRVADQASRSFSSGIVGFAEECGKRLLSSAAVKVAVALCPLAHVAAAAGVVGYVAGSAALAGYEAWRQPAGLSFKTRFLGHVTTALTGHAGTAAHVAYNCGVAAIGRPELGLDSLHALRSQPNECLRGIVEPKPVFERSSLKLGTDPCLPSFGVQRLIQVGTLTQAVPRQCVCNAEIALTHRVLRELPMHSRLDDVAAHWRSAGDVVDLIARKIGYGEATPFYTWLNRYAGNKKRVFAALRHERPPMVHTTKAKVFIKGEKYPRSIEGAKNSPPRIISGCPEELTYHTGPWLTAAAKRAATNLATPSGSGGGGRIYYTCGYNADEIGDLLREAMEHVTVGEGDQLVFLEDDQSKFDQHIGKSAFGALDRAYRAILPRRVRHLLRRGRSRGGMRNGTRFTVDYTMQSGYPDTSFGDTILNAIMKTFIHGRGGNWASLICGDDSVTVTTRSEIERLGGIPGIVEEYAKFGMEVEASYGTNVLDVGYCSGRFLPQFGTYILVPKTGKILAKSFWSTKEYSDLNLRAWANGVCESLDHIGLCDPIVAAVSRVVRSQTRTKKVKLDSVAGGNYSVVYKRSAEKPVDHAGIAYAYSHWYNIFSADVEHLTSVVAPRFELDACVDDPLLNYMVRLDTPS